VRAGQAPLQSKTDSTDSIRLCLVSSYASASNCQAISSNAFKVLRPPAVR